MLHRCEVNYKNRLLPQFQLYVMVGDRLPEPATPDVVTKGGLPTANPTHPPYANRLSAVRPCNEA
jgi:hypothetical protein